MAFLLLVLMRHLLRAAGQSVLDLLLPARCPTCAGGTPTSAFCPSCRRGLPLLPPDLRGREQLETPEHVHAVARYADPFPRLLLGAKSGGDPAVWWALAALLAEECPPCTAWGGVDLLVPMPMDPRRLRERGIDHGALLARAVGRARWRPVRRRALRRIRSRPRQAGLDRKARVRNLAGVFDARAAEVAGARILLIDDVCTTGASLGAAAGALLAAGAAAVGGLVVCRQDLGRGGMDRQGLWSGGETEGSA